MSEAAGRAARDVVWSPLSGEEAMKLLADVNAQLRHPLPDDTILQETRLSCYPRHRLLRLLIPMPGRLRESFALHAPGELVPIGDGARSSGAFDDHVLELQTPEQLIDAVRLHVWQTMGTSSGVAERHLPVESWEDLPLDPDSALEPDARARAETLLGPPAIVESEPDDPLGTHRVNIAVAGERRLAVWTCRVSARGVERVAVRETPHVELPLLSQPVTCDRYVRLERELAYTPQRFLRHIMAGRPLGDARVTGPVYARGQTFEAPVVLERVAFEADVDFGGAVFVNGLVLKDCSIDGRLMLGDARINGSLDARGLRFTGAQPFDFVAGEWERTDLDAAALMVSGSLHLDGLSGRGSMTFAHAEVKGDLYMGGVDIGAAGGSPLAGWLPFAVLDLSGLRVGGDFRFGPARSPWIRSPDPKDERIEAQIPGHFQASGVIRGGVAARRLSVGGQLVLAGLRTEGALDLAASSIGAGITTTDEYTPGRLVVYGDVDLSSSTIGASVVLPGVFIHRDLRLIDARIDGSLFVRTSMEGTYRAAPAVIGGEVSLAGISVGDVEFEGGRLGALSVITGEVGRLFLQAGLEDVQEGERTVSRVVPCRVGMVWIANCTIASGIQTVGLRVGDDLEESELLKPAFIIRNLRCGGGMVLGHGGEPPSFTHPPLAEFWQSGPPAPADYTTHVRGDIDIGALRHEGRLALTNVTAGGVIAIRNSVIEQGLDCGAAASNTADLDDRVATRCRSLDLEMTRVGADADLSGIVVTGAGAKSNVRAHRLRVEGRLLFSAPRGEWVEVEGISQDPAKRFDAVIEGSLDLSAAEASHLVVSGSSFTTEDDSVGINLERGAFRRLHVLEPWPFRHDLSDVKVERWQIPTEHLLAFLERSKPFRRSVYIELERVLRNEAQDAEADRVYRGMRERAIDEARSMPRPEKGDWIAHFARTTGSRLLGWAYGWGTRYWLPILVVALPTFLFSWGLFSVPANVEATPIALVARGVQATSGVRPADLGYRWGASDGFWLALRFHIPVVPLAARGIWEPTNDAARLPVGRGDPLALPFSGESYAYAIYLLHWIVWPLFLYGLGRKVIRDRA